MVSRQKDVRTLKRSQIYHSFWMILILAIGGGCGIDLNKLGQGQTGQDVTANWQSPANYSRTPAGTDPVNPITLSVDFADQSGCPNQTYRFWLFSQDGGTPLLGVGANAKLSLTNHFEQRVTLPADVPVYQVRLSCTQANGARYTDSDALESGSPAFTPRIAISWQNPVYTRTPTGSTPQNSITLSASFTDETGCPYQLYRFWQYGLNGSPVGSIGETMTLVQEAGVSTTVSLPTGVPVYAVRLACVDTQGNRYANGSNLEVGNPAFTPSDGGGGSGGTGAGGSGTGGTEATGGAGTGGSTGTSTGTCSGQNTTLCLSPPTSSDCSICGGTWGPAPVNTINVCSGSSSAGGESECLMRTNETSCNNANLDGNGLPWASNPVCQWNGTACHVNPDICSIQTTELDCTNHVPGYGYGNCTWGLPNVCTGSSNQAGESQCVQRTDQSSCETVGLFDGNNNPLSTSPWCVWYNSSCHVKSTVCTDQATQTQCQNITQPYFNFGVCAWGPIVCSGSPTPGGEAACNSRADENSCLTDWLFDGLPPCSWNGTECHIVSTICTDRLTDYTCHAMMPASDNFAYCVWGPVNTANVCNNQVTYHCASPQTSETCTACGGTWTTQ